MPRKKTSQFFVSAIYIEALSLSNQMDIFTKFVEWETRGSRSKKIKSLTVILLFSQHSYRIGFTTFAGVIFETVLLMPYCD